MKLFFPVAYIVVSVLCLGKVLLDYSRVENFDSLRSCTGKPTITKEDDYILLIDVEECEIMLKKSLISADGISSIKKPDNVITLKYGSCPDGCNYNFAYSISSEDRQYLTYDDVLSHQTKKRIWYLIVAVLLGTFGIYKIASLLKSKR